MEKIERIAVFGAGTIGLGIAQIAVQSGFNVYLYDVFSEMARKKDTIRPFEIEYHETLQYFKRKMRVALFLAKKSEEAINMALNRVQFLNSKNLELLEFADFVIEAIFENTEAKKELYRVITEKVGPDVPIASNTSTIRIETLAQAVKNPERFLGMRFFNPVPRIQLVELTFSSLTNGKTSAWATYLTAALGKTHVIAPDIS